MKSSQSRKPQIKNLLFLFPFLLLLSNCGSAQRVEDLKPRTAEQNQAIRDEWYPIQNKECQLIVDSFNLFTAAMGTGEVNYLAENMDEVQERIRFTAEITSRALFELSQETQDNSIREYALEAVPIFARLGDIISSGDTEYDSQLRYLAELASLTGRVPSGCKS